MFYGFGAFGGVAVHDQGRIADQGAFPSQFGHPPTSLAEATLPPGGATTEHYHSE